MESVLRLSKEKKKELSNEFKKAIKVHIKLCLSNT